jgi:hypothetical protein
VDGTLPSSLNASPGDTIVVSANNQPLYSYVLDGTGSNGYSPTPISSGLMNTGNRIFQQHPIYIDYTTGNSTVYH